MIPVLIGLGLLIGGIAIVAYWSDIVDWLKDFLPKLKKIWDAYKTNLPHAAIIAGDLIFETGTQLARIMHKLYYREGEQWVEETTTRKVDASQVPERIRNRLSAMENDITSEMEEELGMQV